MEQSSTSDLPPSSSSFLINLAGGVCFLLTIIFMKDLVGGNLLALSILGVIAAFIPIAFAEVVFLKVHKRPSVGMIAAHPFDWGRISIKLMGFYITVGILWSVYQFIPGYHAFFYKPFHVLFDFLLPVIILIATIYIPMIDCRLRYPEDGLFHFGRLWLGKWRSADLRQAKTYMVSILLRAYFIPVMGSLFVINLGLLTSGTDAQIASYESMPRDFTGIEFLKYLLLAYFFFASIDMVFAVIGYLAMLRPLDSHVRSVEPTIIGWTVCLLCYFPFFDVIMEPILAVLYDNPPWFEWLDSYPLLLMVWGFITILAMCGESFCTLAFGIRFSNLTYRGLITNGLFRFTKHPQYVCKMINRFLVYMPFLSLAGFKGVLLALSLFLVLCVVYYLRARTEENHLSRYPDYVEYALIMNERSVFRGIAKILPFLRFNEDKAKAGKLF